MARKKLPIRSMPVASHDTRVNQGPRTIRERLAGTARQAANRIGNEPLRAEIRQMLDQTVDAEQRRSAQRGRSGRERRQIREDRKLAINATFDPIAKLKRDTQLQTQAFAHELRRSQIVAANKTRPTQQRQMTDLHNARVRMAVLSAMAPLRQGVNLTSVMQVTGTMTAMWMLSPNVRQALGGRREGVLKGLKNKIADRSSKGLDAKAMSKLDAAEARGRGRESLGKKWQRRLDRMEAAKPGSRDPFTNESAAMIEVGLAESAYAAMRDPSVAPEDMERHRRDVLSSYASAMGVLGEYIDQDGLDREEVSQATRVLVGQRMAKEPRLASVFSELGHGRFTKAEPRKVFLPGKTEPVEVWTGDFVDAVTDQAVSQGTFSLRMPGGRGDHLEACTTTLEAELEDAESLEQLNEMFVSYTAASVMRQYPDMAVDVEDPSTRARMQRAGTMFSSMRADGISQTDQRFIYASAFVDAMESVGQKNPELMAQWEDQFGPDWQHGVRSVVQEYSDLGERMENRQLIEALVERGFDETEATEEVHSLREEQHQDPNAGPLVDGVGPEDPAPEPAEHPGVFTVRRLPSHSRTPRAVILMNQMSDWVAEDLRYEADRSGWYEPGATEPLSGSGSGKERYVDSEVFLGNAMEHYRRASASATLGAESIGRGEEASEPIAQRQQSLARMYEAMSAEGIPLATQDAMMSAAYVNGMEKLIANEPFRAIAVENSVLGAGGRPETWRDDLYRSSVENSERYRQQDDPQYRKFSTRPSAEEASRRQASSHDGYAVWERQFDRLDDKDVPGQAQAGELDVAGSDTVRDRVAESVGALSDEVGRSEAQRMRAMRRKAVRKNRAYNEAGRTPGPMGIGHDEVKILQDGDTTPGREADPEPREVDPEPEMGG